MDNLQHRLSRPTEALAYFYMDLREEVPETRLISVLLRQLLEQCPQLSSTMLELYHSRERQVLDYSTLEQCLSESLSQFQETYMCVDGLDELAEDQFERFIQLTKNVRSVGVHVVVFSRSDVRAKYFVAHSDAVEVHFREQNSEDLQLYVKSQVSQSRRLQKDLTLQETIVSELIARADGR